MNKDMQTEEAKELIDSSERLRSIKKIIKEFANKEVPSPLEKEFLKVPLDLESYDRNIDDKEANKLFISKLTNMLNSFDDFEDLSYKEKSDLNQMLSILKEFQNPIAKKYNFISFFAKKMMEAREEFTSHVVSTMKRKKEAELLASKEKALAEKVIKTIIEKNNIQENSKEWYELQEKPYTEVIHALRDIKLAIESLDVDSLIHLNVISKELFVEQPLELRIGLKKESSEPRNLKSLAVEQKHKADESIDIVWAKNLGKIGK
jgi:hypothetical protein